MPWGDWQFWAATALALGAVAFVVRPMLPRRGAKDAACGRCDGAAPTRAKRTTLTIRGK
jgi:hypothetical protein